jgi:leader peptidase (prepilin peptidase)/N-methyltransferase
MLGGLLGALVGAALGWGLLWLIAIGGRLAFRREAMGFGDVKLMGAVGAFLGWKAVLFSIVASSFVGSLVGLTLVIVGSKGMRSRIPYGPYIALAALLWIFWGPSMWEAYMRALMPASP